MLNSGKKICATKKKKNILSETVMNSVIQWNLSNLTHQTKGPGKCVRLYRMSEYSGFILINRNTLGP
jgi:hypothetical protein